MKVDRILTLNDLLLAWPFMAEGIKQVSIDAKEQVDEEVIFNVLSAVVGHPQLGWVGVVSDFSNHKLGFAIAHDATLLCDPQKTFIVRIVYYVPGFREAATTLLKAFLVWAKKSHIEKLQISTKRTSGSTIRCLNSRQFGFRKPHLLFERNI